MFSHHEAHATLGQIGKLRLDLLGDIPRQDQHLIRRLLAQRGGRADRQVAAGQGLALLGRGGIADVGEQVRLDAGVVEQGVALGGRAISGDAATGALGRQQMGQEVILNAIGAGLKGLVGVQIQQTLLLFAVEQLGNGWRARPWLLSVSTRSYRLASLVTNRPPSPVVRVLVP